MDDFASSFVRHGDKGIWRNYGRNGATLAQDDPAPHEFGHLLGLQDRYDNKDYTRTKADPQESTRWAGNIMANSQHGTVEQRNIDAVVQDPVEAYIKANEAHTAQFPNGRDLENYSTTVEHEGYTAPGDRGQ